MWLPTVACAASLALGGCAATVYRPTQPRAVSGPGIEADIVSVRGAAGLVELAIRTQQPTQVGPITWTTGANESCSSTQALAIRHDAQVTLEPSELINVIEVRDRDTVFVNIGKGVEVAQPGIYLDVKVDTGQAQGCLRLALTATGKEILWQADRTPWVVNLGLGFATPLTSLEGTGTRVTTEVRVLHPLGPIRGFFGFTIGGAGCRGDNCPPLDFSNNDDEQEAAGLFFQTGGEAGIERRFPLGRWSLSVTAGGRLAYFHLGSLPGYTAGKNAGVGGPFASLTLFGPSGDVVPGFSPPARRGSSGLELMVARETAFGRGPTETAWLAALGYRFEFSN
jgi:hypothetical protein